MQKLADIWPLCVSLRRASCEAGQADDEAVDEDVEGDEDEPTARGEIVGGEVARNVGSERLRSVLTIDSATSGGDSDPERLAKRRARRRAAKRRHERRLREGVFT